MPFRYPRLALAASIAALLTGGCATLPAAGPLRFYASHPGDDANTAAVFDALDARLRAEPGFVRDFDEPMNVHIANGTPAADGAYAYRVTLSIPAKIGNRRIPEKSRMLAAFSVTCAPTRPEPCVDRILEEVRQQPTRVRRIVARAPKIKTPKIRG
jgi:hypothetical protein